MRYVIGLDIGISSAGWAILNLDKDRIEDLGVRAFNAAENAKDGASLAKPRREARCARRRLRRRAGRIKRTKDIFVSAGLIPEAERDTAFQTNGDKLTPWQLRAEALDRLLTGEELARALFHIVKRRGFKSNRKKVKNAEDGEMLSGITANRAIMAEYGYRTAGEMLSKYEEKFGLRKRNTSGSYTNTIDRALLEEEIKAIFENQRKYGSHLATTELESELLDIFNWQKPFAKGDDIIKLVGKCQFLDEIRAPRNSYSAERAHLLQKINGLSYLLDGERHKLEDDERGLIIEAAYNHSKLSYAQARKILDLPPEARFTGLTYMRRPSKGKEMEEAVDVESKSTLFDLKGYHSLKKALGSDGLWEQVSNSAETMDHIACALTFYKTDDDIRDYLIEQGINDEPLLEAVLGCGEFTKTANLSLTALKRILPYLEEGAVYSIACEAAGFDHSGAPNAEKQDKLPPLPADIRNPLVLRSLSQARKVVNAIVRKYGAPYRVHIELARDMGKTKQDRDEILKHQLENYHEREMLERQFEEEFRRHPKSSDLLKWRLYREQEGKCAYSMQPIDASRLFEPGYAEIDHAIPYSRSFEDGRANKVLVLAVQNQLKRNRTPYEFFGHDTAKWDEYEAWVKTTLKDKRKRDNLLRKSFDHHREKEWKDRNLNDTRYASREFAKYVRAYLRFSDDQEGNPVYCVNGQITAKARGMWGLEKNREENDLHHALDAAVVAAMLPHMTEELTRQAKTRRVGAQCIDLETGELIEEEAHYLRTPWKNFRKELIARLSSDPARAIEQLGLDSYADKDDIKPVIVSRMPIRKVSGAIHEETIRSAKWIQDSGVSVVKKPLASLSATDLNNLFAPETNEKLYAAIRERMAQYGNNAQKAFAEPLYKPTKDGSQGNLVKSVKVCQAQKTGVPVRGGIADNGGLVRTDVFRKPNKKGIYEYYLVPVYISEMMAGKLPDRAIAQGKSYDDWPIMDETYEFLFSLQKYDLICVTLKSSACLFYYKDSHRSTGALRGCVPNNILEEVSAGARTALSIEKFEMGILGDYYPVNGEKRIGLENGSSVQPGEVAD